MNNSCVEEENAMFERPREGMKNHPKPLLTWGKVDNTNVNKVLADGCAAINLIPYFLLNKMGKFGTSLRPHNMVLSNYEGKTSKVLGVIQVDIFVWTMIRPTLFVVIYSKENYNLLLG